MLKYANPEEAKIQSYQFYQLCVDKFRRTGHAKDHSEMVKARKDFQTKSQYARTHPPDVKNDDLTSLRALVRDQGIALSDLRRKNAQLRRALSIANAQLVLPLDKRDVDVVERLTRV